MKSMKIGKIYICVLVLLVAFTLVGCGASKDSVAGNAITNPDSNFTGQEITEDTEEISQNLPEDRKLIQRASMRIETEDLDTLIANIEKRISELDGYVENFNVQNGSTYDNKRYRSANMTIRIPVKSFNSFIEKVDELSNVVSSQKTVEDITLDYVATESRMKALQAEEARLLKFMSQADTMDSLITVEKRLTEVRAELETVTSALRVLENQVNYSTIDLSINEVTEYTDVTEPETMWQRMGGGFKKSLKNIGNFFKELFVFVVAASPYLVMFVIVPLCIVFGIITIRRKRNKNKSQEDTKNCD